MSDLYRDRDRLVGGTNSPWTQAADFDQADQDDNPTVDVRADDNNRFTGVLSQTTLAS